MTREYPGRFTGVELMLAILSVTLTVGAVIWAFAANGETRNWQWVMFAALIVTVAGQQIRRRRIAREYGDG